MSSLGVFANVDVAHIRPVAFIYAPKDLDSRDCCDGRIIAFVDLHLTSLQIFWTIKPP
jgi:hypothetical protein